MVARWTNRGVDVAGDRGIPFTAMSQHPALPIRGLDGAWTLPLSLIASDLANPVQLIAKLPSQYNYDMGWAHTYSLPREWSISENGQLVQKPYSGLEDMRSADSKILMDLTVEGYEKVTDMRDRKIEVIGEFTVGDADFGLTFYSEHGDGARLYYSPKSVRLVLDMRQLERWRNDEDTFNGFYSTSLPSPIAKGSVMKMQVFVDHSVMDIFINDTWATSVRLYPTSNAAETVEVFSDGGATKAKIIAYNLDFSQSGVNDIISDNLTVSPFVDVYSITGAKVRSQVERQSATANLPAGFYLVDGKKVIVK